ncbi:MAG: UDP-N-acetylmuramoyl-tripeptide--D-alanyl-D-alanine ligase [Zetaproteobacteria bacterium]|nr:UDP-N-acetylmuramoyl-tripeptide--D-alanyl-D-alanine ligase [Zetaproteobacteria bacterium]
MLNWQQYIETFATRGLHPLVGEKVRESPAPQAHQWFTDSRQPISGGWFVPLKGESFDGHGFLSQVMDLPDCGGALCAHAYVSQLPLEFQQRCIAVQDPLCAYQAVAGLVRQTDAEALRLIALTGSVGKTTTKEMIRSILSVSHGEQYVLATEKNYNNDIGVAHLLLSRREQHSVGVVEMGARHVGDIARLVKFVCPQVAMVLNARDAHLEIFGTLENLRNTKAEILGEYSSASHCVVPAADPFLVEKAVLSGKKMLTFGAVEGADVFTSHLYADPNKHCIRFDLECAQGAAQVCLQTLNHAFVDNAAAAAAACLALGISLDRIVQGLERFQPLSGRFNIRELQGLTLVDDCYNANALSMIAGLSSLRLSYPGKKLALFLGSMGELGDLSEEKHKEVGKYVATRVHPEVLVAVGEEAAWIAEAALAQGMTHEQVIHVSTTEEAQDIFAHLSSRVEVAFFKASRFIQLERVFRSFV